MTPPNVKDLLLAPRLDPQQVIALLSPYGFKEPTKADANLQALADDAPARRSLADILEDLLDNASQSADPDQAINYLERFARAAVNKIHLFSYLKDSPRTVEILAKTFGGSPYMAEILIRDPHYLYWVTDPQVLYDARKKREIERELARALRTIADERKRLDYLRALKRREMLRIGVRDLLRLCSVRETLADLSTLAEALISAAHWICSFALRREYGIPRKAFGGFTILAMGKLGGGELNFSSDVDLIYLYASDQEEVVEEAATISASEYFRRLCQKITVALSEFTGEGYVYRVDLRLRPEGKAGNIAYSLAGPEIPRNGAPVHLRPAIRPQNFGRGARHQAQNRSADIPKTAAQPQRQARRRRHPRNRVDHPGAPSLPRRPDAANTRAQHAESARRASRSIIHLGGRMRDAHASLRLPARRREQTPNGQRRANTLAPDRGSGIGRMRPPIGLLRQRPRRRR